MRSSGRQQRCRMFVDSQFDPQYPILQDFECRGGGYTRGPRLFDRPERGASDGGLVVVGELEGEEPAGHAAKWQRVGANQSKS